MSDLAQFSSKFESVSRENGTITWHENDLMQLLGYASKDAFRPVVRRAMQACLSLSMETGHDFILVGERYKLTRFACYLVSMHADSRKPQVAMIQVYLSHFANQLLDRREHGDMVERVVVREEIRDGVKELAATAQDHGVTSHALFFNAGYRGMYNMSLKELETFKGVRFGEQILDRMNRTELTANLFRVSLTDDTIKRENVYGQRALEATAHGVGAIVRNAMIQAGQPAPEHLKLAEHIGETRKTLKAGSLELKGVSREDAREEIEFLAATSEVEPDYTKDPEEEEPQPDSVPF